MVSTNSDEAEEELIHRSKDVYICLHFYPQKVKLAFKVESDTHVALIAKETYERFKNQDTDVIIQFSNSEYLSPQIVR